MMNIRTDGFHVARTTLPSSRLGAARDAITDTIDRVARAMRTPFDVSCPDSPFHERLERVAQRDRAYATALFHAVMADAQRDTRISTLAETSAIRDLVQTAVAPATMTDYVVRTRAVVPTLSRHATGWHQDVLRPAHDGRSCGSVRVACWIPLGDVDAQSGALEIAAGAWAPLEHHERDGQLIIADDLVPTASRRVASLSCGDVLLLDRFVPHRSMPCAPPSVRWAIVAWFKAVSDVRVA